MGRIMRLRAAVEDGQDEDGNVRAGGKPKTSTPADKRLKRNKSAAKPAKVTRGF